LPQGRTQIQEKKHKKQVEEGKYEKHTIYTNKKKEIKTCTHQDKHRTKHEPLRCL